MDELLAGEPGAAAIAEPYIPEVEPATVPELPEPLLDTAEQDVVPITELCYSGAGAFERANEVRGEIRGALAQPQLDRPLLDELVEELLDLVDLSFQQPE
jgi:hypothetical protein